MYKQTRPSLTSDDYHQKGRVVRATEPIHWDRHNWKAVEFLEKRFRLSKKEGLNNDWHKLRKELQHLNKSVS